MGINWSATVVKWVLWLVAAYLASWFAWGEPNPLWAVATVAVVACLAACVVAMYQTPWPWRLEINRPWEDGE